MTKTFRKFVNVCSTTKFALTMREDVRTTSSNRDEGGREEEGTEDEEVEDRLFVAGLLRFLLPVVRCPEEHVHEANQLIMHFKLRAHPTTGSNSVALGA